MKLKSLLPSNPILPDGKDNVWKLQSQHLNWVRSVPHIDLITISISKFTIYIDPDLNFKKYKKFFFSYSLT